MNSDYEKLLDYLRAGGPCLIAFSGGVDSSFLVAMAVKALGRDAHALTVRTPYMAEREMREASELAEALGVDHRFLELGIPAAVQSNPQDRCYLCKRLVFQAIQAQAAQMGIEHVLDGTNADDLGLHRPGLRALKELGIQSPLAHTGFTKAMIRQASHDLNLPFWNKPAYACLLTRLPHDQVVTEDALQRVEKAEEALFAEGFAMVRVRAHGKIARIETAQDEFSRFQNPEARARLVEIMKKAGFEHVCVDLAGYKTGSMDSSGN